MRNAILGWTLPLMLLAACEFKVGGDKADKDAASLKVAADGNVAISADDGGKGFSLSVPGFEGKVDIPGIDLGGGDMDIDGMKLYPGSKLNGINVTDREGPGNGMVDMRFTSPAAPGTVAAYYAKAARDNDFTAIKLTSSGAGATVNANNPDGDPITISLAPDKAGTAGRILIRDSAAQQ